ncbi:MAG: transcription termination factor Rho [Proteobacteria bacterium]|nr:transcription termination factor Rho [Pseudomonadota bacterium]
MGGKKKAAKEKALEKMTAKELRELALTIEGINGVHAMNKVELLSAIKDARGVVDESGPKTNIVRDIKQKIKVLKVKWADAVEKKDEKWVQILRKRIIRLKKKTRRTA